MASKGLTPRWVPVQVPQLSPSQWSPQPSTTQSPVMQCLQTWYISSAYVHPAASLWFMLWAESVLRKSGASAQPSRQEIILCLAVPEQAVYRKELLEQLRARVTQALTQDCLISYRHCFLAHSILCWSTSFSIESHIYSQPLYLVSYLHSTGLSAASFRAWKIRACKGAAILPQASRSCNKQCLKGGSIWIPQVILYHADVGHLQTMKESKPVSHWDYRNKGSNPVLIHLQHKAEITLGKTVTILFCTSVCSICFWQILGHAMCK